MTTTILENTTLDEAARNYAARLAARTPDFDLNDRDRLNRTLISAIAFDCRRAARGRRSDRVLFAVFLTEGTEQAARYRRRVIRYMRGQA